MTRLPLPTLTHHLHKPRGSHGHTLAPAQQPSPCPWGPARGPHAHLVFPSGVTWQVAERSQEKAEQ